MLNAVREFVELTKGPRPRGVELVHVKQIMVELRKLGFSSGEISDLSGGMYDGVTVRDYTGGWDGVTDQMEKYNAMKTLRGLFASGRTLTDVDDFVAIDSALRGRHSSFQKVAEESLKAMARGDDFENLSKLNAELDQSRITVSVLRKQVELDKKYKDMGFPDYYQEEVLKGIKKYGGFEKLLIWMELNREVEALERLKSSLIEIARAQALKTGEAVQVSQIVNAQITSLTMLAAAGWDLDALIFAPDVLKKVASMSELKDGLKEFKYLKEIRSELNIKEEGLRGASESLSSVNKQLEVASQELEKVNIEFTTRKRILDDLQKIYTQSDELYSLCSFILAPVGQIQLKGNKAIFALHVLLTNFNGQVQAEDLPDLFKFNVMEHVLPLLDIIEKQKYLSQDNIAAP
jgi:hypothetical protein